MGKEQQKSAAAAAKKKTTSRKTGAPIRLYTKAVHVGFTRNLANQKNHTALLKLDGVNTIEDSRFYQGKRVAYIYRVKKAKVPGGQTKTARVIWGRITRPHGNSGVVRAKFASNLPGQALGASLRVMLYPSTI